MTVLNIRGDKYTELFSMLQSVYNECRFKFTENGLKVRFLDAANVAMIDLSLTKNYFKSFKSGEEIYGIPIKDFQKVDTTHSDLLLDFQTDPDTGVSKVNIIDNQKTWSFQLIDPNLIRKDPTPPELDLPFSYNIDGKEFMEAIEDANQITYYPDPHSRYVTNEIPFITLSSEDGENLIIEAGDQKKDYYRTTLLSSQCINGGKFKSAYSLDYLTDLIKPLRGSSFKMYLNEDYPLKIVKNYLNGDSESILTILLSPRISNERCPEFIPK